MTPREQAIVIPVLFLSPLPWILALSNEAAWWLVVFWYVGGFTIMHLLYEVADRFNDRRARKAEEVYALEEECLQHPSQENMDRFQRAKPSWYEKYWEDYHRKLHNS